MKLLPVSVGALSLTVLSTAWGQPCEPAWSDRFGSSDPASFVLALDVFDDGGGPALYAGGAVFTHPGDVQVNRIARLEGNTWKPLGAGVDKTVYALAGCQDCPDPDPALYVGGFFTSAGEIEAKGIARWDGRMWSAIGSGITGTPWGIVAALTVGDDGSGQGPVLYAGGFFDTAGGVPVSCVARWDGTAWSGLGSGLDDTVRALAFYDDGSGPALYAGGLFMRAGAVDVNNIARWDGESWSPVGGGMHGDVYALTVFDAGSGPALYAAGAITSAGGVPVEGIARWDGKAWSSLEGGGLNDEVSDLVNFDDGSGAVLVAGGYFTSAGGQPAERIARWDGASWHALGAGFDSGVAALVSLDDGSGIGQNLYAGGSFQQSGQMLATRVARWDGQGWAQIGNNGTDDSVSAMLVVDDESGPGRGLYVGGDFGSVGSVPAAGIARWDGSEWSPLSIGDDASIAALDIFDDGTGPGLYAAGGFQSAGGVEAHNIARWDGGTWSPLSSGTDDTVLALEVFDDGRGSRLYVGGHFDQAGDQQASKVAAWDGQSWLPLEGGVYIDGGYPPPPQAFVLALAEFDDRSGPALYVGGHFNLAGGVPATSIARWDGSGWSAVGSGLNGVVRALSVYDDGSGLALYAGGGFVVEKGSPCSVARWDGSAWSCVGTATGQVNYPYVLALTVYNDGTGDGPSLYAAGQFDTVSGVPANDIASWDGTQWSALGSGIDPEGDAYAVFDLAVYDDGSGDGPALFAGGDFETAGGLSSDNIGRWGGCGNQVIGDLTGDGAVDGSDLVILLGDWGPCPGGCPPGCAADIDGNCTVGILDLLLLLAHWT